VEAGRSFASGFFAYRLMPEDRSTANAPSAEMTGKDECSLRTGKGEKILTVFFGRGLATGICPLIARADVEIKTKTRMVKYKKWFLLLKNFMKRI